MDEKICFVIAPIGEEDSETRRRSDQVLNYVIRPAVNLCGYQAIRADEISEPGIISNQVIQHLVNDSMVIADLTGKNPNVFYELAIRQAIRKPLVQLIQKGELLPFDVAGTRTIGLDHRDLDSVELAKQQIVQQIQSLEKSLEDMESPISLALDLQVLRGSKDPQQKTIADLVERLTAVQGKVLSIEDFVAKEYPKLFHSLFEKFDYVKKSPERGEEPGKKDDISALGITIGELHENIIMTVSTILTDVKEQQLELAKRIFNEFSAQSYSATKIVKDSFSKEICKFINDTLEQEQLLEYLVDSFMEGMRTMGEYQRINIENETLNATQQLEIRIRDSISKIINEVSELHDKVKVIALPF
jgi:hypothetical protein